VAWHGINGAVEEEVASTKIRETKSDEILQSKMKKEGESEENVKSWAAAATASAVTERYIGSDEVKRA